MKLRNESVPPVKMGRIIGGTCSECGNYDPYATMGGDGELHCSNCIDGAEDVDLFIAVEREASSMQRASKSRKGGR
jgi:hypothetical protein